jgi:hypothetical protein
MIEYPQSRNGLAFRGHNVMLGSIAEMDQEQWPHVAFWSFDK